MTVRSAPYVTAIAQTALESSDFRRVVATGPHLQVVVMTLQPGEAIGSEVHDGIDQVLVTVSGQGFAELDGAESPMVAGALVLVPAGTRHNVRNPGTNPLVLYTIYGPPEHEPETVHRTKAEADEAEAAHGHQAHR